MAKIKSHDNTFWQSCEKNKHTYTGGGTKTDTTPKEKNLAMLKKTTTYRLTF